MTHTDADITYEYELIGIEFEQPYDETETVIFRVREQGDDDTEDTKPKIEFDTNGIPLGRSKEVIRIREKCIKDFYAKWISENPGKKVWNENLGSYIFVKFLSINETYNKAARTYESTLAVFNLTDILEKAQLIEELPTKKNNKNQKSFSKMLIMRYLGVKLTVGCQKSTNENVQYSITVPQQ